MRSLFVSGARWIGLILWLSSGLHFSARARETYNFNSAWRMMVGDVAGAESANFEDSSWKSVTLPRAWNEDDAFHVSIHDHRNGIAWYRKTFKLPESAGGRVAILEFEGARQAAEVWINGQWIGRHENGVNAFGFDITKQARPFPEENVIAVRTDSSWDYREKSSGEKYEWAHDGFNANFGGLTKNVKLHLTEPVHQTLPLYSSLGTTGIYVHASDFDFDRSTATIGVEAEVINASAVPQHSILRVTVADAEGKIVGVFSSSNDLLSPGKTVVQLASSRLHELHWWSWGYGYLYTVKTTLEINGHETDAVTTRTGFRATEFTNGRIKLNGRTLQVHGYGQRSSNEWPAVGNTVPPWLSDFSNGMIVEGNGNLIRWMHITPAPQEVESCDRVGLMQSLPAGDGEGDVEGQQWRQRVEAMRDTVIYHRNNPSVIFYESGNAGITESHMQEMKAIRDQFDPKGGRAAGCRDMLGSKVAEYGGEMLQVNKSAHIPFWAMEYSRDEGLRKYWDELTPPFHHEGAGPPYRKGPQEPYNHNQDAHAIEDVKRWYDYWRERPGTGTRVNAGGVNIIFSDSNTHFRGAENYRRSGEVDPMRIPKDGYFAHQVMWDGWVNPEHPRLHIIGHWNYKAGTRKSVYVVSNTEKVELTLNGRSLGFGTQSSRFLYSFPDIAFADGELRAIGYDETGKQVTSAALATSAQPVALRLSSRTRPGGWTADGSDLVLVEVEVVDAQGRRCPTALNEVNFDLTGPAEWRGGIAQGPDNYILSKLLPVEGGVNRVFIRSFPTAGKVVVTARSANLASASLELESETIAVRDGLSEWQPENGLPSMIHRGPTPSEVSLPLSRLPVVPVSAAAGANVDRVKASFDDDETTLWTSGDRLEHSWIEYQFAHSVTLTEVVAKLADFRKRAYPIRISIDGQEIYRGITTRSFGYVTLPVRSVTGTKLKIQLLDAGEQKDVFNIVELENQKNADVIAQDMSKTALGIVEIEFYQMAEKL